MTPVECDTVAELVSELESWPHDCRLAVLYDHGGDVKWSVHVVGLHQCGIDCDDECVLAGTVVLDIDPDPRRPDDGRSPA